MIESRRGRRLTFLLQMIERIRGDVDQVWEPPLVILVTREKEWERVHLDSGMRVHCIEPPLNASNLSQYL